MAYVNPVPNQGMQQQETLQQENPNKIQEMLLANAMQPQTQQPQQQQQGGGGMGGMGGGMGIASKFMGGGSGSAAGGSAAGGGTAAASGSGSSGASAGGGMGGGWWAALAAAILANESNAKNQGRRSDNDGQYAQDLLTGEVLQQDLTEGWGTKVFGDNDYGFGGDTLLGVQASQGDFGDAWQTFKDQSTLAKLLGRDSDKSWTEYQ